LDNGDFNVIVADWSVGANTSSYFPAVNRTTQAGVVIAEFCDFLATEVGIDYDTISLVGHSLGAYVSGMAGKNTRHGKIHTIHGLDPAGPCFSMDRPNERLDSDDARYVENIVTNGGKYGFYEPIGTATFYPNWGSSQPGCRDGISCSHARAYELFAESLYPNSSFKSVQCKDFSEILNATCTTSGPDITMGGEPSNWGQAKGVYFLRTNSAPPFSMG
jgi:pancreatic triacylglycerol lipase